jgi:hypothetical protein
MNTKIALTAASILTLGLLILPGCSQKTTEEKITEQVKEKQYALNADERSMALTNAKQYYEKQWLISDNRRGQVTNCRPSDSNANGMVSCFGIIPAPGPTGYQQESKIYCGYRPELVGCSDQDTVK